MKKMEVKEHLDGTIGHYTYFDVEQVDLVTLLTELYTEHWDKMLTAYIIQGAVFELFPTKPEKIGVVDGYLTVDTANWHIHLCLGYNRHNRARAENKDILRELRRVKKAAFVHTTRQSCTPESWSLQLWNGDDQPMIHLVFPNPYLKDDETPQFKNPDWDKLALWYAIQEKYLGIQVPWQRAPQSEASQICALD